MSTALEKLLTIVRLVHEADPHLPIVVHLEGPQRGEGWCYELALRYSPNTEQDELETQSMIPALGAITCGGGMVTNEHTAKLVVTLLENLKKQVEIPVEIAAARRRKRNTPEFGDLPPSERLVQWREWAAKVAEIDPNLSDADLRLHIGGLVQLISRKGDARGA